MKYDKYKSSKGSRTVTIGELYLRVKGVDLTAQELDTLVASEFEVEIEFTYTPGYEGTFGGSMEDAEEGVDPQLEIDTIKPTANVQFSGDASDLTVKRGTDLMEMFSNSELSALEDEVLKMIEAGGNDD